MKSRFWIAGNWKMYKTPEESREFVQDLEKQENLFGRGCEVILCVPFTSLVPLKAKVRFSRLGAQNMFYENEGAFTGEISPRMLTGLADYVLIGHSERRQLFGETDSSVNRKIKAALTHGLKPIVCIGETLAERETGETFARISLQLEQGLAGLDAAVVATLVFAYEPVWAIGTGRNATAAQAQEVHDHIHRWLSEQRAKECSPPILYGGSVKPENSLELLQQKDIDGLLIGGASLKCELFSAIIKNSLTLLQS